MIARHLCDRLRQELAARDDAAHISAVEIALEESFGQAAYYREALA